MFVSPGKAHVTVVRRKDESIDDLIKRFKRKFTKSGVLQELKEKAYYEKPSVKRKRKSLRSRREAEREESKIRKYLEKNKNEKGD